MPSFILLLRGVNVGKGNRVPMATLRSLLESLGHTHVRTLLNSGNAVFESALRSAQSHANTIREALKKELGLDLTLMVISSKDLASIIATNPFPVAAETPSHYLVAFAQDPRTLGSLEALKPLLQPTEHFQIGQRAAYLFCDKGILKSAAGEALLGKVGRPFTTRNWNTVQKLHALVSE
jgi:uncharacterized protein (DUF1697 family)